MIRFSSLSDSERSILCKKVFTQAAAARILGDRWGVDLASVARQIKIRCEWEFVCWVHVPGHRPIFVSKMEFIYEFISFRSRSALEQPLSVYVDAKYPTSAIVESLKVNGRNLYTLDLFPDGIRCNCHDFSGQEQTKAHYSGQIFLKAFNKYLHWIPTCKHIFKFLFSIDIYSQAGWIENQRWADRWTPTPWEPRSA